MKIAFYCPLKPISHPVPSGDREIARGLHEFFQSKGADIFILSEFRTKDFYRSFHGIFGWLVALLRAYRDVKRQKPDCFFTYHLYYKAPDPIASLLSWWFQKPYFVFEGMYSRKAARRSPYWVGYWFTRFALRRATKIYSDKTDDLEFLLQHFSKEKVSYVPPSLSLELFSGSDTDANSWRKQEGIGEIPIVATVAMLRADRKTEGIRFLLRALQKVSTPFHWVLVGDGDCFPEIQNTVKQLGWSHVSLVGKKSKDEVARILASSDLFAFPGYDEGFGFVFLEAQASFLPVVAFQNGGIPDAVKNEETGYLVGVDDVDTFALKLQFLLENAKDRKAMGLRARKFVEERFDRKKNYEAIWLDLVTSSIQPQ